MKKAEKLPQDVPTLHQIVGDLREEISHLHQQIKLLRASKFGPRNDHVDLAALGQKSLFEPSEIKQDGPSKPDHEVKSYKRGKPKRKPLPPDLPEEEIVHDLDENEKQCGCGHTMDRIGEETTSKVERIPATYKIVKHIRPKYACKACEGVEDEGPTVKIAPLPPMILPKSMAGASLLADIVTNKYVLGLPLYRQEQRFQFDKIKFSRKTMTDWILKLGEKLQPMWRLMLEEIRGAPWIGMDETHMKVFEKRDKKNKTKHKNGHMWVMYTPLPRPMIVFRYHPGRDAELPKKILAGYQGTVVSDEWRAYDFLDRGPESDTTWKDIAHAGCWVHARRKFVEVITAVGKKKIPPKSIITKTLKVYKEICELEDRANTDGLSLEARLEMRQTKVKPMLEAYREELIKTQIETTPAGALQKAINYTLRNWPRLILFLENPMIPTHNNGVENAIRPFVIGRKNWLFAGSAEGAQASAVLYSLAESAKANGSDPFAYFKHLFTELPKAESDDERRALLPTRLKITAEEEITL